MHQPAVRPSRGFTLIELMVTVAVIAILAVVAIPNLRDFVHNNRLRATSNELVASLQAARMEAVRLNSNAIVCRSTNGTTCAGGTDAWAAWVVLADVDHDGAADDLVRTGAAAAPVVVSSSESIDNSAVTFGPDGMARTAAGLPLQGSLGACITETALAQNRRVVRIRTGSRFQVVQDASTSCARPGNT